MELIKFLLGDANWEFKWFVIKLNVRIWMGELHVLFIDFVISVIQNQEFWLTGFFVSLMFFCFSKEADND